MTSRRWTELGAKEDAPSLVVEPMEIRVRVEQFDAQPFVVEAMPTSVAIAIRHLSDHGSLIGIENRMHGGVWSRSERVLVDVSTLAGITASAATAA